MVVMCSILSTVPLLKQNTFRPRPLRDILRRPRPIRMYLSSPLPVSLHPVSFLSICLLTFFTLQILTGSSDRQIRLFNPLKAPPPPPISPSITTSSTTSISSVSSGLIQTYSAHGYEVLDIAVSEDNARFASVGGDRQVFLWDVAQGRTLRRWSGHGARVNCVGIGGEGGGVVASGE